MAAGLQVFNDSNTIQVDQDYIGFALSAKGTVTMTLDPVSHPQPMRIASVTVSGTSPIIAFFADGKAVNLLRRGFANGQWTFSFCSRSNADFTLNYWVFDLAQHGIGGGGSAGLQVYRADGTLAFDAFMKPIRVVAVIDLTPPADGDGAAGRGLSGPTGSVAIPSGKTYALVQGSFCYVPVNYDDGYYSGSGAPVTDPDGGGGIPPNATGKYQVQQGYHSAGGKFGTNLEAGLYQFETFRATTGLYTPEISTVYGDLMFWAVDVTNY